jgi:hypothetical protein
MNFSATVRSALIGVGVAGLLLAPAVGAQVTRVTPSPLVDATPPAVTQLSVAGSLDLNQPMQRVRIRLSASDDVSGLNAVRLTFKSPSGANDASVMADLVAYGLSAKGVTLSVAMGSGVNGVGVQPWAESGRWQLAELTVHDMAGNTRRYGPTELAAAGWASQFEVANPHVDILPPILNSGLILTPMVALSDRIPATALPPVVRVSLDVTDKGNTAISGLQQAVLRLCRVGSTCGSQDFVDLVYEGAEQGVERRTVLLRGLLDPLNQNPGDYAIASVSLYDHAWRNTWLATQDQGGKTNFLKYFPSVTVTILP